LIRGLLGLMTVAGLSLAAPSPAATAEERTPAFTRAERLVPVSGGRLRVVTLEPRDRTSGPDLLLLHGASGNLKDLELSIGRRLAARRPVILVDRPGHGGSDRLGGREMAAPAAQAKAVVEALDRLGVGQVVAVGHSWSGALATALALDHPDRVAGLALLSPATHPFPGGVGWYNEVAAIPIVGDLFAALLVGPIGRRRFDDAVRVVFAPREPPPDYVRRTDAMTLLEPAEFKANAQDLVDLKGFLRTQARRYEEIGAPTVIVTSDRDHVVSPDIHARPLHRQIRGSKLVVLKDAGHMPQWTATARVAAEIEAVAAQAGS
jgi:pimeloyl-ACP methyl ester carboxylesterase